ncbi:MAG: bifunctional serine/threonine-protein kinase/formylglycine-generating enzyme family protein [Planctomycetota bacterium]|nr:bifunctional serine/threonine-protein kinase/formylglycine-generating enzyme family protein [Planctomycetota bacterium]
MSTSGSWSSSGSFQKKTGPVVGQDFAHFEILETIGAGGMGAVFKALDKRSQSEVALKVLSAGDLNSDLHVRFQREAEALRQLEHPNIVKVGQSGVEGETSYFAMELLRGQSLKSVLHSSMRDEDGRPLLPVIVKLFKDIASALSYCHAKNIVHRDLKPDNIVIEEHSLRPVLVDFGLVRRTDSGDKDQLTKSSDLLGTPHYMSPEQVGIFSKKLPITEKTDVWSFGVTLFNALTGQTPFSGETTYNIFTAMVNSDPKRSTEFIPDLPPWLDELCSDCLQKNPVGRPTMQELYERLLEGEKSGLTTHSSAWIQRLMIVFAALSLVLPLALYYFLAPTDAPVLKLKDPGPIYLKRPFLTIQGQALPIGCKVNFNGRSEWRSTRNGVFEQELKLLDGENSVVVTLQSGSQQTEQTIEIIHDSEPPRLTLSNTQGSSLRLLNSNTLRGQVLDKNIVTTMKVDGELIALSAGGQFAIPMKAPNKVREIQFRLSDKAGNVKITAIKILSTSAFRKIQKRLLSSRKQWVEADEAVIDLIIQRVTKKLNKHFDYKETKNFQCGGLSHRIALFLHRKTGIEFCLLPGGAYLMGRTKEESPFAKKTVSKDVFKDSWDFAVMPTPIHRVRIPPFLISRHEVSRLQWQSVLGREVRKNKLSEKDHPAVNKSWMTIQDWLKKAGGGLRLPSESEWEYACRAGTTTRHFWGDQFDKRYALVRFGKKSSPLENIDARNDFPNAFGLVNMIGGVWEWCEDHFEVNYRSHPHNEKAMKNLSGLNNKVIRGHSNTSDYKVAQCAERMRAHPQKGFFDVGFRVAVSLAR